MSHQHSETAKHNRHHHAHAAPTDHLRKVLKACHNKQGEGNLEEHLQKLFNFLILHYPN